MMRSIATKPACYGSDRQYSHALADQIRSEVQCALQKLVVICPLIQPKSLLLAPDHGNSLVQFAPRPSVC